MRRPIALSIIKSVLRRVVPNAEVILYGSEARGDARPDSDFDLLILEDVDNISYSRRMEILGPLYELSWKKGIEVSPILMTKKNWKNRPFITPFYLNVINDGIKI